MTSTAEQIKADIEYGNWWQECTCGRQMYADYILTPDGDELPPQIVTSDKIADMVFCSHKCAAKEERRIRQVAKRKVKTIARARRVWGDSIEVTYASGESRSGWCKCDLTHNEYPGCITFKFPGSLGDASGCPWCGQLGVQRRDLDAWRLYVER